MRQHAHHAHLAKPGMWGANEPPVCALRPRQMQVSTVLHSSLGPAHTSRQRRHTSDSCSRSINGSCAPMRASRSGGRSSSCGCSEVGAMPGDCAGVQGVGEGGDGQRSAAAATAAAEASLFISCCRLH